MKSKAALVLATAFIVMFIGGGARFAIGLIFKPMVEELGWARSQLGLAVGLYMLVSAGATFVGGRLADRASPRLLLTLGTLIGGAGLGLMAFATEPWHAMLFYGMVFALGNGMASMAAVSVMVTRVARERAGLANAVAMSGLSVGQLVMMAVLTLVLVAIGWRSVFAGLALAHVGTVALLWFLLPNEVSGQRAVAAPGEMGLRAALRTGRFWILAGLYAICGMDDFFVATHVVAFAQDKGIGAVFAGNLLAAMGLAAFVGVLACGFFSDRFGAVATTAISFVLRIAVFGLLLVDQSPASIVIFALVFGATFLVTAPMTVLFVRDCFGTRHLGALTGLITMIHQIFAGVGAYGGAVIFDRTGSYDAAFVIMLVASAIALGLSLMVRPAPQTAAHR